MIVNKIKYFATAVALFLFFCASPSEAQENSATETLGETNEQVTYEKMFNNVEETEESDILTLLRMEESLSTFVQLLEQSELDTSIEFAGPVTLLAPTNEAFQSLTKEQYEKLTDPENRALLTRTLKAHILPNKVYMRDFEEDQIIETSEGEEIPVGTAGTNLGVGEPSSVVIGGAQIVKSDVEAENGIIHVVDEVIIPEETRDSTLGTY